MNKQDLKAVEEIKRDYKEILNSAEKFYNLIEEYKKKYSHDSIMDVVYGIFFYQQLNKKT